MIERLKKAKEWIILCFQGMMIGIADLIPGVSGGTIAFVLGLYPELLLSLRTLHLKAFSQPKSVAWFFLSAIVLGMLSMIVLGSHVIYFMLNNNLGQCLLRSLFMGLVVGSIFFCLKQVSSWSFLRVLGIAAGMCFAFLVTYHSHQPKKEAQYDVPLEIEAPHAILEGVSNYDTQKKLLKNVKWAGLKALYDNEFIDPDAWIYSHDYNKLLQVESCIEEPDHTFYYINLFVCGALAISAMILPGISGTQVMQIMGHYETIIQSIAIWTSGVVHGSIFNESFWILFSLGLGILVGIFTVSRLLLMCYRKYFSATLATLIGFMIGSIPTLWPFWEVSYHIQVFSDRYQLVLDRVKPLVPSLTSYQTGLALLMFWLGLALVILLERRLVFKKLQLSQA